MQTNSRSNDEWHDANEACSDFLPSFSNHGLCLTRNGEKAEHIFKTNSDLLAFQNAFIPHGYNRKVTKIDRDQSAHDFTFIIDGNNYKNLKRGDDWNTTSYADFNIGIHSPNEAADIRGWNNRIIKVATGQHTTIRISLSQQKTTSSARNLPINKRGCRFGDENDGLSSIKWYSQINCLMDCQMEVAENTCGCRPWDYPTSTKTDFVRFGNETRICEFFGSSCFNRILQSNVRPKCRDQCDPDCEKVYFAIDVIDKPLDYEKRICEYAARPFTDLEFRVKNHIQSLYSEEKLHGPPERRILNLLRDILTKTNDSYYTHGELAFEKDCIKKLRTDIAVVTVSISSPTYQRMTKNVKASWDDKLAWFGKKNNLQII